MPDRIAFDTETFLITPGNLAPRPVVASFADRHQAWLERFFNPFDNDCAEETIDGGLLRPGVTLDVANGAYDFAVIARRMPRLLKAIFDKYERGEVWDVQIVAALDAVADGRMTDGMVLARNGQPLREFGETGRVTSRFSLSNCVWLYLNRLDAKANDAYRLRYGELSALPTEQWPAEARQYPLDDARNTFEVATVQRKTAQNTGPIGKLLPGVTWETFQARAAWCMHLGAVWGFRTNKDRIAAIEAKVNATLEADTAKFKEWGLLKPDGKENRPVIKRAVAVAYGADDKTPCPNCKGGTLNKRGVFETGKVWNVKHTALINCKTCDSTGIALPSSVPRTPADGIATDRDTLDGTGLAQLEAWAEASKNDKMRETYLPWLKQGIDAPISARPNPLIATGRCSYDGLVQLIPPLARECIEARPGYVCCSTDYPSLELCTLAQVTYWTVGFSRMREVINVTRDPGSLHTEFGAKMAGVDPSNAAAMQAFAKAAENKASAEYRFRFMAKAANFGFPGGMGVPKLVLAKRKEGLFFCIASGKNTECKPGVLQWRDKELSKPTCPDCLEVAAKLREDWFAAWPEIKPYFDWVAGIEDIQDGHGVLCTPGTGYIRGGLTFTSAANHSFQHLGAMAAKHAMWLVCKEAYCEPSSALYGARPWILVHDEIFGEVPEATMTQAGYRTAELMRQALQLFCPDINVPTPEPAFSRFWYKQAKLVMKDGVAVPWEPKDAWRP